MQGCRWLSGRQGGEEDGVFRPKHQIGKGARYEAAAFREPEMIGGERGHLAHGLFERKHGRADRNRNHAVPAVELAVGRKEGGVLTHAPRRTIEVEGQVKEKDRGGATASWLQAASHGSSASE